MMRRVLFVIAIAGCGGGAKSMKPATATTAAPASECAVTATHVADAVFTWKEPPPTSKENVVQVITERCEQDQWSAEAKKCFGGITTEDSARPCVETLTKDQHDKVMNAMEAKFDHKAHKHDEEGKMGGTGARPTNAPPPPPGGGSPAKGADPCEGGE